MMQITKQGRLGWIRTQKNIIFFGLRNFQNLIQCVVTKKNREVFDLLKDMPLETVLRVRGQLVETKLPIKTADVKDHEIFVESVDVISRPTQPLPFLLSDADESLRDPDFSNVGQSLRLDKRFYEMRSNTNQAIFRITGDIERIMRGFLYQNEFHEIHSPKLIGTATEGGASVFSLDYFGRPAYLTQSPQLYKQMAIMGDLNRVFEVGPVFRAENAATHRHLTQFTGFDLELEIESFDQLMDFTESFMVDLFQHVNEGPTQDPALKKTVPILREYYGGLPVVYSPGSPDENITLSERGCVRIRYPDAIKLINQRIKDDKLNLEELNQDQDLGSPHEKLLGKIMKERYDIDFFLLIHFPLNVRPFYTQPAEVSILADYPDTKWSNSFDMILFGEEISSGGERVHDIKLLESRCQESGIDPQKMKDYIECFSLGAPTHGGFGIGLERLVMLLYNLKNVRKVSMFPRDGERLAP